MSTRTRCPGCGAEWPADTESCYKCGAPISVAAKQQRRETEGPKPWSDGTLRDEPARGAGGPYRDKDKLVMTEGEEMPRRCPLCNSEDVVDPVELSLRRESKEMGGVSGLAKAGMNKLAGWNYTGPVDVSVCFCQRHRGRFRNRIITGLAITGAGLIYLLIAWLAHDRNQPRNGWIDAIVAVVGAFVGIVIVEIYRQNPALSWFKPRRFVDRTVWVTGACRPFLESLPSRDRGG